MSAFHGDTFSSFRLMGKSQACGKLVTVLEVGIAEDMFVA